MGYELRRWLADRLPSALSSGERLVALEIADQANDQTRKAYGPGLLDLIIRRCGFADAGQIGKVLAKLGARGLELRVPMRGRDGQVLTDRNGRPMYACKGHETTYRIPRAEECPALKHPQAGDLRSTPAQETNTSQSPPAEGTKEPQSPPAWSQRSPARGTKVPRPGGPSPHTPQISSNISQSARDRQAARHLRQTYRLTDHEVTQVLSELDRRARWPIENLAGYMVGMKPGELADIVAAVMDQTEPEAPPPHTTPAAEPPPWPLPVHVHAPASPIPSAEGLRPTQAWTDIKDSAHAGVCKTARCPRCEAYRQRTAHAA